MPSRENGKLSPHQVAEAVGVDEKTVRRWLAAGLVEADRTVAGRWLVSPSVVTDLKRLSAQGPLNAGALRAHLQPEDRQPKI